jgi:hypothetical protein
MKWLNACQFHLNTDFFDCFPAAGRLSATFVLGYVLVLYRSFLQKVGWLELDELSLGFR